MSLSIFTLTSALITLPWLYFFPPKTKPSLTNTRSLVNVFLLLHTLYILYFLIVWPPQNIFSHLGIPLSTPTDTIRSFILEHSPKHHALEQLVTRMGSFETRTFYVRFGHNVVATCEHCHSFNDFAIYAVPGFLLAYIREAAVIGVATIRGTGRERFRSMAIGILFVVSLVEVYWIATVNIRIPRDTMPGATPNEGVVMWHDRLTLYRSIFFILFPLAIHFILRPPPPTLIFQPPGGGPRVQVQNPHATLQAGTLQSLLTKLQLLRYTRGAIARSPTLTASSQEYWQKEKNEGEWVRNDPTVQSLARKTGFGFEQPKEGDEAAGEEDPSKLRKVVRNTVHGLLNAFAPSDFWKLPQQQNR